MPKEKDIFLVAKYSLQAKDKTKSNVKGYLKDQKNIGYDESVVVTRGLKDRDLTAGIILNLTQKTVFKCRFEGKNDWETLAAYYAKGYPQYMKLIKPEPEEAEEPAEIVAAEENSKPLKVEDLAEE